MNRIPSSRWFCLGILAVLILGSVLLPRPVSAETDSLRVMRLFMWASSGSLRFRDKVQPAKDSIAMMGVDGARWLVRKLGATDARERHTLADIFEKLGAVATPCVVPYLDSAGEHTPKNAARVLGFIDDTAAVSPLIPRLSHPEYSVRSEVATALGKIGDSRAAGPIVDRLALEPDSDVRKSLTVALGVIGDSRSGLTLVSALGDEFFGVRQTAILSLAKLESSPVDSLMQIAKDRDGVERYGAIVALGTCKDKKARRLLRDLLQSEDPMVRGFAVEAATLQNDRSLTGRVEKLKRVETDPFVRAQISRFDTGSP